MVESTHCLRTPICLIQELPAGLRNKIVPSWGFGFSRALVDFDPESFVNTRQLHGTCCCSSSKFCSLESLSNSFKSISLCSLRNSNSFPKPLVIVARANTRKESAKVRNIRLRKKFNGSSVRPRLSVFCSSKQLYAMLVDDHNKKCLFYGSTLQKSIRESSSCSNAEAAQRVGEELVKACIDLKINEISSYDRNGFARGERMAAFEIAIKQHGFLQR